MYIILYGAVASYRYIDIGKASTVASFLTEIESCEVSNHQESSVKYTLINTIVMVESEQDYYRQISFHSFMSANLVIIYIISKLLEETVGKIWIRL